LTDLLIPREVAGCPRDSSGPTPPHVRTRGHKEIQSTQSDREITDPIIDASTSRASESSSCANPCNPHRYSFFFDFSEIFFDAEHLVSLLT
jgi:hypothetical protein